MLTFLKALVGANVKQAVNELTAAAVAANPTAATQAEMAVLEKEVDEAARMLAELKRKLDVEKREAEVARRDFDRLVRAAESLQNRLANAGDADRAEMEQALGELVLRLEEAETELAREEQDVVQVEELIARAMEVFETRSKALAGAKQELERAVRDMQRAKIDAERAKERAEDAAKVAGLRDGSGGGRLGIALKSMQETAAKARAEADAMDLKADSLSRAKSVAGGNKHLQLALQEADNRIALPAPAASDRLAALIAKRKG